ncbi:Ctr copper transporter family-domain-containing protein [Aspergillus karnatakaensis]|uniref:copper transporter family protein n=1 Tax=Aspergillus karnatakaensis TaxID=1810916 RepID=UPI003CCDA60E
MDMNMDMDMDMSTTTSSMSMPTPTSDKSSMSSMQMDMSTMSMTFFTSFKTVLYSPSWNPTSEGQYAGTCIYLIVLAVILRVLIAFKPILERSVWTDGPRGQKPLILHGDPEKSVETGLQRDLKSQWSNWKINSAGCRATYEVVLAGVAYLLMIAVMTMNVGYFLSVLGGIWLGTFILGHLAADNLWSHH